MDFVHFIVEDFYTPNFNKWQILDHSPYFISKVIWDMSLMVMYTTK